MDLQAYGRLQWPHLAKVTGPIFWHLKYHNSGNSSGNAIIQETHWRQRLDLPAYGALQWPHPRTQDECSTLRRRLSSMG
eukprot:scaffold82970_cov17-Tisochrysis_lutea.AAC.1